MQTDTSQAFVQLVMQPMNDQAGPHVADALLHTLDEFSGN